ncbi:hydantoinase/oxoprolinase family protein [Mesorhizobium sp. M1348]|uniref:hydantoinase/oxoprolinase family protein n=1 Tax=Mesorhizobium sp. M1348 TaxID=2957089 RepID=UPI003335AACD
MLIRPYRIGVDVGGTFTDLLVVDASGEIHAYKSPSVPSNPAQGVIAAMELAASQLGISVHALLSGTSQFVHGSTVATNTLLEKKGAKTGLLTTEGFRDSLEIRRGFRDDVWDHRKPYPDVLVPRYLRLYVSERMAHDGTVIKPLDLSSVDSAIQIFKNEQVESVAVSLLHAYRNPAHEKAVGDYVRRSMPGTWVTESAAVAPIIGEYERTSTVVVNGYIAPRVTPYLTELDRRLSELGLPRGLLMVQSNGGAISVPEVANLPVRLILSGPAAGVGALRFFGHDTKSKDLMAIEVGGTSCDVTLVKNGAVSMTDQINVDGFHLTIPAVEIHTVGAGGGTIGHVDSAGMMQAGPQGAGARPGPACYGFGGEYPTVTDANLVLGRLKPGSYAGGAISLNMDKATDAVRRHLSEPLGIDVEEAAIGLIKLVEQNIQHAIEKVSVERGYNPRLFTLVAAGGAGALHGPSAARSVGCSSLYVPRLAGVFCAFGMCNTDVRHDYSLTWLRELNDKDGEHQQALDRAFDELQSQAEGFLHREGFSADNSTFIRGYEMRYVGQQWNVSVDCQSTNLNDVRRSFETTHERLYGYFQEEGPVLIAGIRLAGVGVQPPLTVVAPAYSDAKATPTEFRRVWVDHLTGFAVIPVYDGRLLLPGQSLSGPAIIDESTTTLIVGSHDELNVTAANNYLIKIGHAESNSTGVRSNFQAAE